MAKANTKELIKKFNIRLTKSLGQNFLNDDSVVGRIVDAADVNASDLVIEIGPGVGSMTTELARRAGRVAAIEIDRHLIPALTESLKEFTNIVLINQDVLKADLKEIISQNLNNPATGEKFTSVKVVANLPYYITTPIIMKLLEDNPGVNKMVFMVQKEVAERMVADPGGKDYGALSVAVQYYSKPEMAFQVPPHCFIPQPEVDSTVIRLDIYSEPPVNLLDKVQFFRLVKASFGQRRKTLVNALKNSGNFNLSKDEMINILKEMGIDERRRGETLSITQFAELSNIFTEKKNKI
ncbi:MAG: rsmA [Clostridiales bacterium]|jgi:16S rRNA (adenine1518-N6/adenine1519-N6)-dimethyltransferase|nr:rsmA [Clostridiales bacterium]